MLINILKKALSQKCHTRECMSIVEIKNPRNLEKLTKNCCGFSSQIIKRIFDT